MKNRLSDLNNHLFAQLERLSEEGIGPDKLDEEVKRAGAIVDVADQIIKTAALSIRAAEIASEYGSNPDPYLRVIEGRAMNGHMAGNA